MLSFLSPITPTSTLRQSIPASYVTISVTGNVDINVYADINGQWVSGDRGSRIVWDYSSISTNDSKSANELKRWSFKRETEMLLSEIRDHPEWGTLHFVGPDVSFNQRHRGRWGIHTDNPFSMFTMRLELQPFSDSTLPAGAF